VSGVRLLAHDTDRVAAGVLGFKDSLKVSAHDDGVAGDESEVLRERSRLVNVNATAMGRVCADEADQ
jgi:hypothetical protein